MSRLRTYEWVIGKCTSCKNGAYFRCNGCQQLYCCDHMLSHFFFAKMELAGKLSTCPEKLMEARLEIARERRKNR